LDLRAVRLGGARDLLLARQPQLAQGAGDGHGTARGAEMLAAFLERGIGPLSDQLAEPLQVTRREDGRVAPAVGLGPDGAGAPACLQEPDDEGEADDETAGDLADRALLSLHGIEDTLSEILGRGGHGSPPHQDLPSNRMPRNRSALYRPARARR